MLSEQPSRRQIMGMALAFAGVALIALSKGGASTMLGLSLTVMGGASWALSNIYMKRAGDIDMFALFVWVAALGAVPMLLTSVLVEGAQTVWSSLVNMTWTGVLSVLFMAYGATLFGFGLWGYLLRHYPAGRVASFSLLVPVFGMGFSWLFLQESLTVSRLSAAVLILFGLYLVVVRRKAVVSEGGH